MSDANLSIYDFCRKYKEGTELPSGLLLDIRRAILDEQIEYGKKFPDGYCVEADEFLVNQIDLCEKLMLVTDSKDDCRHKIVQILAFTRDDREFALTPQERERRGKYLGTLGQDIKALQERAAGVAFCYQPGLLFRMLPGPLFLLMAFAMLFVPMLRNWFLDPAVEGRVGGLVGLAAVAMFIIGSVKLGGRSLIRSFLWGFGCAVATMLGLSFLVGLLDGMADPGPYVLAIFATLCLGVGLWLLISAQVKAARITAYNREVEVERKELLTQLDKLDHYAQTCKNRAQYLKLDTYLILICEEYCNLVQYYTDIVHSLDDIRASLAWSPFR